MGVGISITSIDFDDVIKSAVAVTQKAVQKDQGRNIFMVSSAARNWALGTDLYAEMEKVMACIQGSRSYHFSYAGGEICPIQDPSGKLINQFYNDVLIVCIL
ncbi:hypothetical protein Holit_02130 [Hollandina sp. SP2]